MDTEKANINDVDPSAEVEPAGKSKGGLKGAGAEQHFEKAVREQHVPTRDPAAAGTGTPTSRMSESTAV